MKQNNFIVEKNGFLFKDLPKDKTTKELKNSISVARRTYESISKEDIRKAIESIQNIDRNVEGRQFRFVTNQAGMDQFNRAMEDYVGEMSCLTEGRHVTPDFIGEIDSAVGELGPPAVSVVERMSPITMAYNTTREIVEQDLLTQLDNISREHGI